MLRTLLWKITRKKTGLSRWLRGRCLQFLDCYNDFSYDFRLNGEYRLLEKLSSSLEITTVFDVGANVGEWSMLAASFFPKATIHCFELSDSTRSLLRARLADPRFVVHDFALGSHEGRVEYLDFGGTAPINTMVQTSYFGKQYPSTTKTANMNTGDNVLSIINNSILDFMKIDVEGAEYDVLKGFEDSLRSRRVRVIQFEYGYLSGDAGHLMRSLHGLLSDAGYKVGKLWTSGVTFGPFDYSMNDFKSGPNYLAVSNCESSLIRSLSSFE